jgi:hypothetical protein
MRNLMTYNSFVSSVLTFKERHTARPTEQTVDDLPEQRPTRCAVRAEDMSDEWHHALESADLSHIDPELDKLMH